MITPSTFEPALLDLLSRSLKNAQMSGESDGLSITLDPPRQKTHGDLSSSIAMQLASKMRRPPLELAQKLAEQINQDLKQSPLAAAVEKVEVKPPGFINFFLSASFLQSVLSEVFAGGANYGRVTLGAGKKTLIEFVSANPTGPLSVAHGRQAAVGDALANLLEFAGYPVGREYYLNDEGTQIDLLGASLLARAREAVGLPFEFPENGYKGAYVGESARRYLEKAGKQALEGPGALAAARRFAAGELTEVIRGELDRFGIRFDQWFPQSSLNDKGYLTETLEILKKKGALYESEGAWWLKSTAFGDDKDRVVIRSDGRLTYIAADIAYHRKKFERGWQMLVNLWGPDHHGYIARLTAAVEALGHPAQSLQIRIVQLCTLKRGSEVIPMSTREGQFITLTQVMDEVGVDAARFFFLLRKMDAHLEFDLELAKKHSLENPVYYIQYAHARIGSLLQKAVQEGLEPGKPGQEDHSLLTTAEEMALLRLLRGFPAVVESCARALEPYGLLSYLQELAEAFHRFYDAHRIIGSERGLAAARLDLIQAARTVLANGLRLLGVSTPEQM